MAVSLRNLRRSGPVSVKEFGAKGNGVQIDGPYIKNVINAYDDVYCPPGTYLFDKLVMPNWKGKRLRGSPGKTIFKHVGVNTDQIANGFFGLGNLHPYWYDNRNTSGEKFKRFAVTGALAQGARIITLSATPTGGDATDLGATKLVWVRHATEFTRTGWAQPDYAQLCRVKTLSGATLTLEEPLAEAISSAIISPIGTDRADTYLSGILGTTEFATCAEDSVIEDIIFEGGSMMFPRMGAYRCTLRNLEHRNALWGLLLNAFVDGQVKNVKCDYSTWGLEAKMSCYNSIIDGLHLYYKPIAGVDIGTTWSSDNNDNGKTVVYAGDVGERSYDLTFIDLQFHISSQWVGNQRTLDVGDAWRITFDRNKLLVNGGSTSEVVGIRGNPDASAYPPSNIDYLNGDYKVGITKGRNVGLYGTAACPLKGIRFVGNRWTGVTTSTSQHIMAVQYCEDWSVINERCYNGFYLYGQRVSSCLPPKALGNLIGFSSF